VLIRYLVLGAMVFFIVSSSLSYAHSGRTDSSGGHNDNKNGGYHYHNKKGNSSSSSTSPSFTTPQPYIPSQPYVSPVDENIAPIKCKNIKIKNSDSVLYKCCCDGNITFSDNPCPCSQEEKVSTKKNKTQYDRNKWGRWIDLDLDCQDTRSEILIRDNLGAIKFISDDTCSVSSGLWICPYTGKVFQKASDIDIDHVVPLHHAWLNGADKWTDEKRKIFANDPENLLATEDNVNQSKGSKGITEWLPNNESYHKTYIKKFIYIKRKYGLNITDVERLMLRR